MFKNSQEETINYFVRKHCVFPYDRDLYKKAGSTLYDKCVETGEQIDTYSKKVSLFQGLQEKTILIGIILIIASILLTLVPCAFLEIYGNNYVSKDIGKVETVSDYWEAINVRDGHGHVISSKTGGDKVHLTGHYKFAGFKKFAEIGDDQWISTKAFHDHLYDFGKLFVFNISVVILLSVLGWFFMKKESQYEYEIERAKKDLIRFESNLANATSMDATYRTAMRLRSP